MIGNILLNTSILGYGLTIIYGLVVNRSAWDDLNIALASYVFLTGIIRGLCRLYSS